MVRFWMEDPSPKHLRAPESFLALFKPEARALAPSALAPGVQPSLEIPLAASQARVVFTVGEPLPGALRVKAVHGPLVASVTFPWDAPTADGFVFFGTTEQAASFPPLALSTADCLAVALTARIEQSHGPSYIALALVHAGWRGFTQGILQNAVLHLVKKAAQHGISASDLLASFEAVISPAIFGESYECGADVRAALDAHFATRIVGGSDFEHLRSVAHVYQNCQRVWPEGGPKAGKIHPDLQLLAVCELSSLGLRARQIQILRVNTFGHCVLPSFRQATLSGGNTTHRMFSHLVLVPGEAFVLPT